LKAVISSLTAAYVLQDYCRSLYRLSSLILRRCVAPQLLISYNEQVGSCILEPTLARQVFETLDRFLKDRSEALVKNHEMDQSSNCDGRGADYFGDWCVGADA
jgi:hypothetical protein